jgi:hypothetical protein
VDPVSVSAAKAVGTGVGLLAVLRFVRWLIEFAFRRFDVSHSQLGARLKHVEQELDAYREATMLMIGVVAKLDPGNAALLRVSHILRSIAPRATVDLDELARRLSEIPGLSEEGRA